MNNIDRDTIIITFSMVMILLAFIMGARGNEWAREVFQSTWVLVPAYLGVKNYVNNKK